MFCPNVIVIEHPSFHSGSLQNVLRMFGERQLGTYRHHAAGFRNRAFHILSEIFKIHSERLERGSGKASTFARNAQKQVFRSDMFGIQTSRFISCVLQDFSHTICKAT